MKKGNVVEMPYSTHSIIPNQQWTLILSKKPHTLALDKKSENVPVLLFEKGLREPERDN